MSAVSHNDQSRLTVIMPNDSKRLLARLAFETEVPMADMVRRLIDDWLIDTKLPAGVALPLRLAAIKQERRGRKA